jgi:hypothetical protein
MQRFWLPAFLTQPMVISENRVLIHAFVTLRILDTDDGFEPPKSSAANTPLRLPRRFGVSAAPPGRMGCGLTEQQSVAQTESKNSSILSKVSDRLFSVDMCRILPTGKRGHPNTAFRESTRMSFWL